MYPGDMTGAGQYQMMMAGQMGGGYGDEQAGLTGLRSAYGDTAAQVMMGPQIVGGGITSGFGRMFSDMGRMIRPVGYSAPPRVETGFYGQYATQQGFFRSMAGATGMSKQPWGTGALEHRERAVSDFAGRMASGTAYAGSTAAMLAGGFALSPAAGAVGGFLGSALGPVGAAIGAGAGTLLGGFAVAGLATNQVMEAVEERRQIQDYLEQTSFRYVSAGSEMADPRTGRGMSRRARRDVAESIRQMDISDPTLDTADLTRILQGADQQGLFTGAGQDIETFKRRFKEIVTNVKEVSKVLHQSLDEALGTMRELKNIGISQNEVQNVIYDAKASGIASGRTASEMVGLGLQGANLFRGTGVDMDIGFRGVQMNMTGIRAARDAGMLSQSAITQAGGEEAMAMQMNAGGLQFAQSTFGRGYNAAFMNGATGGFNGLNFTRNMLGGGGGFMGRMTRAGQNLMNPANAVEYSANQEKYVSEMGKTFGGQGLTIGRLRAATDLAGELQKIIPGLKPETAFRQALKDLGVPATEIEGHIATMKASRETFEARQKGAARARDERIAEESARNNDLNRLTDRFMDKVTEITDTFARPVNRAIDDMTEAGERFYESNVYGIQRGDLTGIDINTLSGLAGEGLTGEAGPIDLDRDSLINTTQGEAVLELLESGQLGAGFGEALRQGTGDTEHEVTLKRDTSWFGKGSSQGMSRSDARRLIKRAQVVNRAMTNADKMKKSGQLDDILGTVRKRFDAASENIEAGMGIADMVKAVLGKDIGEATSEEIAAVTYLANQDAALREGLEESRDKLAAVTSGEQGMDVADMQNLRQQFEGARERLGKTLGMDIGQGVMERVAMARRQFKQAQAEDDEGQKKRLMEAARANMRKATQMQSEHDVSEGRKAPEHRRRAISAIKTMVEQDMHDLTADLDIVTKTGGRMGALQERRGSALIADALVADLDLEGHEVTDSKQRASVKNFAERLRADSRQARLEAVMGLTTDKDLADERRLLAGSSGVGNQLVKQSAVLNEIKDAKNADQVKSALLSGGLSEERDSAVINATLAKYEESGNMAAVNQAYTAFQGQMASKTAVTAAGAGAAGTEEGTAQEGYAKLTAINALTYVALETMVQKLRLVP